MGKGSKRLILRRHCAPAWVAVALLALVGNDSFAQCTYGWRDDFQLQPVDGRVFSFRTHDDGSGPALFIGGEQVHAGGVTVRSIAKWDGVSFSALADGLTGGFPTRVQTITTWDDGSGLALYPGGVFTAAGDTPAGYIAKWDGVSWTGLGAGMGNPDVYDATAFDDGVNNVLIAGGVFSIAGGQDISKIAQWDGANWSDLAGGCDNIVHATVTFDDGNGPALYAGGYFAFCGGGLTKYVAKWDGTQWTDVGGGMNAPVVRMAVVDLGDGPALYAGGYFTQAGGVTVNGIAKWDGTQWTPLGDGVTGPSSPHVRALAGLDDGHGMALYVGGRFNTAGGLPANNIAKWDGATWTALGSGVTGGSTPTVRALGAFDDGTGPSLYVGGEFTAAGGIASPYLARWGCLPATRVGDLNCDERVDLFDVDPFVLALSSAPDFAEYYAAFPDCNHVLADVNLDGAVDLFDIDPFVELLTAH